MAFGLDDVFGLVKSPGVISSAISAAGGLLGNFLSSESASSAQDFSAQQYATRYQTTVKDLEAAGLSPMLAYSQGAGSPPTGVSYTAQNPFVGVPSAYASTRNLAPQEEQLTASAAASRAQAAVSDETVSKVRQEVENLRTDNDKAKAAIDVLREDYQNRVKEGYNLTEQGNVMRATVSKIKAEIPSITQDVLLKELDRQLKGFDIKAASDFGNAGRSLGQIKPFFDILSGILRSTR